MYVCKTVLTPKEGGKNTVYLKKNLLPWLFSNASTNKPQSNILEAYYITLLRPSLKFKQTHNCCIFLNMVIYIFKLSIFLRDWTFMVAKTLQKSKFLFYVLHLCYVFYYIFLFIMFLFFLYIFIFILFGFKLLYDFHALFG